MKNFLDNKKEEIEWTHREEEEKTILKIPKIIKYFLFSSIFLVIFLLIFSNGPNPSDSDSWFYKIPILGQIKHLVESADKKLKGEEDSRINILLLGMGGKNHEGGYLTDTIILVSLDPNTKKISMLSIPRDMTIPVENSGWRKINNINAFAEMEEEGSGGIAISQALGDILNIPIDYYFRIDFEGFMNIIDEIDGINVYVDNILEDKTYPIMGMETAEPYEARFEHLYIEKGWQKMDGSLALKYARSRHAAGLEGSDFARARRQQKIISAAKDKMLSKNLLFHPTKVYNIIEELNNHISTNLKVWEIVKLWQNFKDIKSEDITSQVLDNSIGGLLREARGDSGAYILTPRSGDFNEIQYLVNNILSEDPSKEKIDKIQTEKANIDIRNGTWINGLASRVALDLQKYKFNIVNISNCSKQNFEKSIIYDLTYGEKIDSLTVVKEKIDASVSFNLPQWLINDITEELKIKKTEQPDFILILGQDADPNSSGLENLE